MHGESRWQVRGRDELLYALRTLRDEALQPEGSDIESPDLDDNESVSAASVASDARLTERSSSPSPPRWRRGPVRQGTLRRMLINDALGTRGRRKEC